MKEYRILCLTDHKKHSQENSLYALVSAMSQHEQCKELVVASRSNEANNTFFDGDDFENLYGLKIEASFSYESAKEDLLKTDYNISSSDYDIVFLRLPRPVSDEFLTNLEASFDSKYIINRPSGIIRCSNKSVLLNFQDVCPPIKLCYSIEEILEFSKKYDLVLKPLREYGGKGLLRIKGDRLNDGKENHSTSKYLRSIKSTIEEEGYLAMKYLKNVDQGDKRLIVVGGKVLAASLRLPASDSWLCNVAMGGRSVMSQPDKTELKIIEAINPYLSENGILIYGADTLVDDDGNRILSEINALSIGGFPQAEEQTGKPIIQMTINKIFADADIYFNK